jgi:phosphotriesterase-related protein
MHEHLASGHIGWQFDVKAKPYDRKDACVAWIKQAQEYGLQTIVDATTIDGSRDPELFKMISDQTGVNIICSTGFYPEILGALSYFKFRALFTGDPAKIVKEIYEIIVTEITEGIGDSGVKPGLIKLGTSKDQITPYEVMIMEAAAMAHKETGIPIITHTEAGTMGPQQAEFFISRGVKPEKLMIGHMCGNANLKYQLGVLRQGTYVSFDRFGIQRGMSDRLRIATMLGLIGMGYENRLMMSHDFVVFWLGREFPPMSEEAAKAMSDWNMLNIFQNVIPALKQSGITDQQIHTLMVENPRRLFEGS